MATSSHGDMPPFEPVRILSIETDGPLPELTSCTDHGWTGYSRALILVRLHQQPVGVIEVTIPNDGLDANELAIQIWEQLEEPIRVHMSEDGHRLPATYTLNANGLKSESVPACLQARMSLLEDPPFVSIVIATRDRLGSLKECLQSLLELDYPNFEIIVVDNAPKSDATEKFIRTSFGGSSKVRYIREDMPGLAIAHNRALIGLTSPIVAFTDDDVVVDRNWLSSIVVNFQRDPRVGCVTGMILPYELETLPQLWIEQFGGFGKGCRRICFDMDENRLDDILYPYSAGKFGSGANMAFCTSVLQSIGGFDPSLGAGTIAKGGDDLAVFFDVLVNGHRLVYEPAAILYHKHRRDYSGLANQAFGYGVGLSAYLMRTVLTYPKRLIDIAFRVPAGLKHILSPKSSKNQKKSGTYPRELTNLEIKGFIRGPFAYIQSRLHTGRRLRSRLGS